MPRLGLGIGLGRGPVGAGGGGSDAPVDLITLPWNPAAMQDTSAGSIDNGEGVLQWTATPGGAFRSDDYVPPIYVAASGVHTAGANAALTVGTPLVLPEGSDWDLWLWADLPGSGTNIPLLGRSDANGGLDASPGSIMSLNSGEGSASLEASIPSVLSLFRFSRIGGVCYAAFTGAEEAEITDEGLGSGGGNPAVTFDTILAIYNGVSGDVDIFAPAGAYIRAIAATVYPPGYADLAAYRAARESALAGEVL